MSLGWKRREVWETCWYEDEAFGDIPATALAAFEQDADAEHLRPYVKPGKTPMRIAYRALTADERLMILPLMSEARTAPLECMARANLLCFRIGTEFPDQPATIKDDGGAEHPQRVNLRGVWLMAQEVVEELYERWPGLIGFLGRRIYQASFPTEPEKKASSQQSTPTLSVVDTERQAGGAA